MRVFLLLLGVLAVLPARAEPQADAPPATVAGKVAADAWRKAQAGEAQDLIVLFDAAPVDAAVRADLARRGLAVEDDQTISHKAQGYRDLKQPLLALLKPGEAEVRRDYSHLPMALVRFNGAAGLERLLAATGVLAAYENRRLRAHLAQSLPLVGQVPVADVMNRKGSGATVAVLDTGVDYTRSEFGSCTSPGVPSGCRVVAAYEAAPSDGQRDDVGHGTEVAGTVAGVASLAAIAAVDVFDGSTAWDSDVILGIDWVISNRSTYNIKAINMSLGDGINHTSACTNAPGPGGDPFFTPIQNARNAGMVVVASSGNEGYTNGIASPACVAAAVSVGAVYDANVGGLNWGACTDNSTAADKVTCFSNSASQLDLLAPGALITVAGATVGGTSFSAPMVAGAVAVLGAAFPAEAPAQIEARLTSTGKAVLDTRNNITKPRLNLLAAQGTPANDAFSAAVTLSGDSGTASGWNFNATKESGEPGHAGNGGGASVWWQWTATSSGTVTLDTHGSDYNTLLAVYTGNTVSALTAVAANNDDGSAGGASGLTFHADAGVAYRIAVDGNNAAAGGITLNRSFAVDPPPSADLAITLADAPDPATVGDSVTYALTVTNLGPAAASGVTATLTLPAGMTFILADSGCSHSAGTVTCALGSLAAGTQAARNIQASAGSAGSLASQASVSASSPADGDSTNNAATATTTVYPVGGGGAGGGEGDAPLPAWALWLLGAGLLRAMRRRLAA